jgi:hypothetical protein
MIGLFQGQIPEKRDKSSNMMKAGASPQGDGLGGPFWGLGAGFFLRLGVARGQRTPEAVCRGRFQGFFAAPTPFGGIFRANFLTG